jgi:hypothetical protein
VQQIHIDLDLNGHLPEERGRHFEDPEAALEDENLKLVSI